MRSAASPASTTAPYVAAFSRQQLTCSPAVLDAVCFCFGCRDGLLQRIPSRCQGHACPLQEAHQKSGCSESNMRADSCQRHGFWPALYSRMVSLPVPTSAYLAGLSGLCLLHGLAPICFGHCSPGCKMAPHSCMCRSLQDRSGLHLISSHCRGIQAGLCHPMPCTMLSGQGQLPSSLKDAVGLLNSCEGVGTIRSCIRHPDVA